MREIIQDEAVNSWLSSGKRNTIVLPTGVGKTFIGGRIIKSELEDNPNSSILVVVPNTPLIDQWKKVLKEKFEIENINVKCIQTAHKENNIYDLIVVDEVHSTLSEVYREFYRNNTYFKGLGLTATPPQKKEYLETLNNVLPICYTKTLDEVVGKAVANYTMYNVEVNFDRKDRAKYDVFDSQFKKAQLEIMLFKSKHKFKDNMFDIAKKYSSTKKEILIEEHAESEAILQDLDLIIKASKQYWSSMTMRKWTCYESNAKLKVLKEILDKYKDKKWIIFNKSIKFAEKIKKLYPESYLYHSKMSKADRAQSLIDFSISKNSKLIAVDALNAGIDVEDADAALTVSGVSTKLTGVQQLGRIIRKKDNKLSLFVNLYTKDTVEENWTRSRSEDFKSCKWVKKL